MERKQTEKTAKFENLFIKMLTNANAKFWSEINILTEIKYGNANGFD